MTTTKTSTTNHGTEAPQEGGQVPPADRSAGLNTGGSNVQRSDEEHERAKDLLMLKVVAANSRVFLFELERQWCNVGDALFSGRAMPLLAGEDLSERWHSLLGGLGDLMVDLDTIANGGVVVASVAREAEPKAERSALLSTTPEVEAELKRVRRELQEAARNLEVTTESLERITLVYRRQARELETLREVLVCSNLWPDSARSKPEAEPTELEDAIAEAAEGEAA